MRRSIAAAQFRRLRCAISAVLALLSFSVVAAEKATNEKLPDWAPKPPSRVIEDKFRAEALMLYAGYDTVVRIDETLMNPGTVISGEDDLALDDAALLPQAEITLLPGKRHLLRLSGLAAHRSADTILERRIEFDDEIYLVGERVDSELDLTMVGFTYGYRFVVRDRGELTGTLGVQVAEVEANAVVRSRVIREAESAVAPIPLLGLEGRFDFTERWGVEARGQYLTADIDEVKGEILDLRAALTWRMNPHFVFGLGYRTFSIEVDSRDADDPGLVELKMDGPVLFMRASL